MTKARAQIGKMYPRRILTRTERVQMLQPIYAQISNKSRRSLRRVRILVCTRSILDPKSARLGIRRHGANEDRVTLMFEESPTTTRLSGSREPPSDQSIFQPSLKLDKGKAKMSEYEDPTTMCRLTHSTVSSKVSTPRSSRQLERRRP